MNRIKFWVILRQIKKGSYLSTKNMYMQIKNFKFKSKPPLFQYLFLPAIQIQACIQIQFGFQICDVNQLWNLGVQGWGCSGRPPVLHSLLGMVGQSWLPDPALQALVSPSMPRCWGHPHPCVLTHLYLGTCLD